MAKYKYKVLTKPAGEPWPNIVSVYGDSILYSCHDLTIPKHLVKQTVELVTKGNSAFEQDQNCRLSFLMGYQKQWPEQFNSTTDTIILYYPADRTLHIEPGPDQELVINLGAADLPKPYLTTDVQRIMDKMTVAMTQQAGIYHPVAKPGGHYIPITTEKPAPKTTWRSRLSSLNPFRRK